MDIPLPGEIIPFPSSSPPLKSKSPPPMPPLPPDFDHIPLPPSIGKPNQSPPAVNHLSKPPPLPPTAPPLPPVASKALPILPPLPSSPKGVPSVEAKGNGEAILWSSIPPPPAPAPPSEDSKYSPSHATPADEENERMVLPPAFTLLPPPPPPSEGAPNHPPPATTLLSPPKMPPLPPQPPTRPPPPVTPAPALLRTAAAEPPPPLPAPPPPPPKTAVLGKMQAKKRLLAFSMTKQGGGLGLSFGFAKSTRVVNKASANAFVGSGEDEESAAVGERKEQGAVGKGRKKRKEEREVLAIEEIKREEERLKEALGIRQQAQRAEQWAEEMWGMAAAAPVGGAPEGMLLAAPTAALGAVGGGGGGGTAVDDASAAAAVGGEGGTVAAADAAASGALQEGAAGGGEGLRHHGDREAQEAAGGVLAEVPSNAEHGEAAKGKEEMGEGKEERKGEGVGGEKRDKKGEKGSSGRSKKDKESSGGGERSSRRRGEESGSGDKERSKRAGGKGGGGGSGGRSERRSERKRDSRRSAGVDGPPSGWKQLKDLFGGEWKGEKIPQRMSGSREDRDRDRRGSRSHSSRSRDHKRSGHSSHRSRSGSADIHRRPQPSPFFVAKGAKHGEKEFPLRLLRHTRTRPPLSYCENPETAAPPRPPTRKEAFASEPPEVVRIMRLLAEAGLEKESEGRENSKEASGLAALRVSYEGGDEEEADDEQKRSDRSWFLTLAAFLSDGSSSAASAKAAFKRSTSPEDHSPVKEKDKERKRDEDVPQEDEISADSDVSMKEEVRDDSDAKEEEEEGNEEEEEEEEVDEREEEEEEEMVVKDEIASVNEASEPTVHSKWDSDNDSGGMSAPEDGKDEATPSPEIKKEQLEVSEEEDGEKEVKRMEVEDEEVEGEEEEDRVKEEVEEVGEEEKEAQEERREEKGPEDEGEGKKGGDDDAHPTVVVAGHSESERSVESEVSGMESEGEEKKDHQLASEYEEFMKAVSVGEEDDEDDVWEEDRARGHSAEVSDHRDSDSSERKPSKPHAVVLNRSSDVEMASDAPSSDDASTGRKNVRESSSDNEANRNSVSKEEMEKADEKAISFKEKSVKRRERSKRDNSESAADSEVEIQIPKKKRKTSGKKLASVGEGIRKKTGGDKKKKLKTKEKSDRKRKEKERKRKRKKKDRRKKKGRKRRDDSSDVESESEEDEEEEGSDSNEHAGNAKGSRSKASDGIHKRRSHKGELSSEEVSSDSSSESSDEADRRKPRKKKRKKRKKHEKSGSKEDEEEMSDDEGDGRKGKPHSSHKKRSRETRNKYHRDSDNSDGSDGDERGTIADVKSKSADCSSVGGKENGVESGGKRGRKQKLKERGRKKKRKSSPPSLKKHASSRRRSPSTSDGSPTPGRGSHQRGNSVGKTQGSRGGTSEGGPSSIESNSSGGTKKHGDNTVQERKPSESTSRGESGRDEASSSQRKSQVSEREERRSRDSGKSKSLKDPSPLLPKSSGSASKEKGGRGGRGGSSARKSSQESVSKKRAAEQSLNTSSSSSSSSPSSLSFSSISSSSSSTESSSSASSQSDSHSVSSSSSSSSSSASSSASSNSSSSSSSSSLSSFVNLPSSLSSLKVVSAVMEKIEPKIFKKDNNQTPPLISVKDFSKSRPLLESPEPHVSDVSFSSLSRDSSKLHLGEMHHFEESLSKRSRTPGEKCKIPVNDKKDDSQMYDLPRKRSDCGSVDSTNASECSSSEPRPAEAVRKDREPENLIDPPEPRGRTCGPFVGSEKVQLEQRDNSTPLNSTSKTNLGSRESKSLLVNPEQVTFKLCSEDDPMNGKILGDKGISSSPSQPSRPSRWDSRPVISESQVVASSGTSVGGREGVGKEWRESSHPPVVTAPVLPVLPVPFPTCRDKPLEEIPLPSLGSVPQPVASPWGPEGLPLSGVPIVLSSAELPINPVCGLADSTISDSDLAGKGAGGGGLLQTVSESSPNAKKVSLDKPNVAVNRPTSSESEQSVVEQFPVDSNLFLKTRVNRYQDTNQQSVGDKVVESATSVFSVDKPSLAKNTESAALSGETECPMSPEADQPPTDWDDPEAFVGPGLSEIKSHVIQVGNFLQVVPSEQPIVSHSFANPSTPIPVVPPPPLAGGVAPVPVPPAAPITTVLPVAAPSSVSAAFPAPVSPVKTFQSLQPAHSSLSLVMPAVQSTPPNPPEPASPSVPPAPSSTLPSTPPPPSTPSTMLSSVLPSTPSLPSPTTSSTLSHLPLLASLAPSSSCGGMSQLPLDPATILGTLISHALALEKQQKQQQQQQQNLVHSPVCSPLIGGENDEEAPNEAPRAMTRAERQARRLEKRKKMARGVSSQLYAEKFPVEDAMSNTDPLTNAMTEDYCIDPEEVALIQEAMSKVTGEEEEFEEQSPQVCRVKEKRKKPKVLCNTVLPPATRGILIPPGLREKPSFSSGGTGLNSGTQGQRKSVMFADGVRPGEGTSPSAGEDLPSPPPPVRKVPKEKRLRKKKKIKVKIIRQIRMETTEEDDDEDDDASPPPPPPGSPPPSLMIHHLSASSPTIVHHPVGGCEVPIPNPAAHYPYPSAPTIPPTHAFSQLQVQPQPATSQPQLPPLNPAGVPPPMAASGGSALPPNALPRIPQWAPCN